MYMREEVDEDGDNFNVGNLKVSFVLVSHRKWYEKFVGC